MRITEHIFAFFLQNATRQLKLLAKYLKNIYSIKIYTFPAIIKIFTYFVFASHSNIYFKNVLLT